MSKVVRLSATTKIARRYKRRRSKLSQMLFWRVIKIKIKKKIIKLRKNKLWWWLISSLTRRF